MQPQKKQKLAPTATNSKLGNNDKPHSKEAQKEEQELWSGDEADITWQPGYWGYKQRFVDDCVIPLLGNKEVILAQAPAPTSKDEDDSDPAVTGTTIWDGGLCLAQYLASTDAIEQAMHSDRPVRILELGAGTGAVSLSLAVMGKARRIILTDLACMVTHLEKNVMLNQKSINKKCKIMEVKPLRWGREEEAIEVIGKKKPEVVVGSDLVYYSGNEQSHLLMDTLKTVCGPDTILFMSFSLQHQPEQVQYFLDLLRVEFTSVIDVSADVPKRWRFDDIRVVKATGIKEKALL